MCSLIDTLAVEILSQICEHLTTSEISCLSRVSKSTFSALQSPLYRHIKIDSFESLALLVRSLNTATLLTRSTRRQILTMRITFDRLKQNQAPTPVLVSRMTQALSRHYPDINISLRFLDALCRFNSVMNFAKDVYPRVTKITLYLGSHGSDVGNPSSRPDANGCKPNAGFWRPFLNGASFPDLKSVQLHHYWARNPPGGADILGQAMKKCYRNFPRHSHARLDDSGGILGPCFGLEKLEEIFLDYVPELNSSLLGQILNNQASKAVNLKKLELRFCNLEADTLAFLLGQQLDSLTHFALLLTREERDPYNLKESPHLCSLMRSFCKNLVYLKYLAPHVCRDLFLDEQEARVLRQAGISTDVVDTSVQIDRHAIREVIEEHRNKKARAFREDRVAESVTKAVARNPRIYASALKANIELQIDHEENIRKRLIEDSKTPWTRSIVALTGLCHGPGWWAELMEFANMEEAGVEWILTSWWLSSASRHSNGIPEEVIEPFTEELYEYFAD